MRILYNDQLVDETAAIVGAGSPALRWGVGLIETMYLSQGSIRLLPYHIDRLRTGMMFLQLSAPPDAEWLYQRISRLLADQGERPVRLRLQVLAEGGGQWSYFLGAMPLDPTKTSGLKLEVYPDGRKQMDAFAGMKTSSHLLYHLAGAWVANNGYDEALVLNSHNQVADGSRTNIFLVKNKKLLTPAMSQGCVYGVMRRAVIEAAKASGIQVRQDVLSVQDVLQADEVMLTNALRGIMSVGMFRERTYPDDFAGTLWSKIHPTFC